MSFFYGQLDGAKLVLKAKSDASLSSFSSFWWGWRALDESGSPIQEGAVQLAGLAPGTELVIELGAAPADFDLFPIRNYTPYPVSVFKTSHMSGTWLVQGRIDCPSGAVVWLRLKSKRDAMSPILSRKIDRPGPFSLELVVPEPWDDIDVVKEAASDTLVMNQLVCTDVATSQKWAIVEQASRPLHSDLEARGNSLVFLKGSSNWSYFTCVPVPF